MFLKAPNYGNSKAHSTICSRISVTFLTVRKICNILLQFNFTNSLSWTWHSSSELLFKHQKIAIISIFSFLFFNNHWLLNLGSFLVCPIHNSSPLDFLLLVHTALSFSKQDRNNPSQIFPKLEKSRRFIFYILQVVFSFTYPRMCFLQQKDTFDLFPDWISRSFPEKSLST